MLQKDITILGQRRRVFGDPDYLGRMGEEFEPETCALLAALCDADAVAIDIGANIGLTALALWGICRAGKILAIEPVPRTFELLKKNLAMAGVQNVSSFNIAVGAGEGSVSMFVNERNLAASFVVDIDSGSGQEIPLTSLDALAAKLAIERLDFIKIDVEGCELEVLKGAEKTLGRCKPIVMLEMNHWCLNIFRRVSLPEYRETLLRIFPCVFAFDQGSYLDFADPLHAGAIYEAHVFENRYMNIVAGFDRRDLVARLERLKPAPPVAPAASDDAAARANVQAQPDAAPAARGWKMTTPVKQLGAWLRTRRG